jgi:hypothetical protein
MVGNLQILYLDGIRLDASDDDAAFVPSKVQAYLDSLKAGGCNL